MMKFLSIIICTICFSVNAATVDSSQLIIKLRSGNKMPITNLITKSKNLFENVFVVKTTDLISLEKFLKNNPAVEYVERSYHSEKRILPTPEKLPIINQFTLIDSPYSEFNDPLLRRVWTFNDALLKGVSVNASYKVNGKSVLEPIVVAVVDTGVDVTHEDLKNVMWTNSNEIPNNGIDDDHNGYIDDVYGINTIKRDSNGNATGNISPIHPHGTHVSGIIAAEQNNNIGIAGIASNVKIMAILTVPENGDETDVNVAESFIYAARNGARIINCSFGKNFNEGQHLIPDTLKYIAEKYGILVVVAAGNESNDIEKFPTYPASYTNDNLLVVASTTNRGTLSGFSNYGIASVDIGAPGSAIVSTVPNNKYESMSGTSMATPVTVGVAAEILGHYPLLTYTQLKNILMTAVTKSVEFKNIIVSGGRVDLLNGLELARRTK